MKNENNYNSAYKRNNNISNNVCNMDDNLGYSWVELIFKIIIPSLICTLIGLSIVGGVCYVIDKLIYNI